MFSFNIIIDLGFANCLASLGYLTVICSVINDTTNSCFWCHSQSLRRREIPDVSMRGDKTGEGAGDKMGQFRTAFLQFCQGNIVSI